MLSIWTSLKFCCLVKGQIKIGQHEMCSLIFDLHFFDYTFYMAETPDKGLILL